MLLRQSIALLLTTFSFASHAQDYVNRPEVALLRGELATEHQFDAADFDNAMAQARRLDQVIAFMDAPVRAPAPWHVYWPRHIGGDRFARAGEFVRDNNTALRRAEVAYGVPPEVVAAIIGVETIYGRITGNFRVIDALATLAFDYPRRAEFFREELKQFFLLSRELKRSPLSIRGSFAGAMGWPQFMPSSYRKWAVDFDNDQRIDLFASREDIVGSVASFLAGHGWERGGVVMLPVAKPSAAILATFDGGLTPRKAFSEWQAAGVEILRKDANVQLPAGDALAGLISLDRADGENEYWITFENFYVITRYNRSRMYASSVWSLAYALQRLSAKSSPPTPR
ncbi:MAG: lytic murein transglycosylase B [Betaproteobacteria bacterium]|nr:MAG: lytic murein transglycosylase B [Betaproteobacteria bacterium]